MDTVTDTFTEFFKRTEPRLRHALIASYGVEAGTEAASEALAYGWEHWERIRDMDNPAGYLFRVGRSRSRRVPAASRAAAYSKFEPGSVGGTGASRSTGKAIGSATCLGHLGALLGLDLCRDR